jgi:hypothetical protein
MLGLQGLTGTCQSWSDIRRSLKDTRCDDIHNNDTTNTAPVQRPGSYLERLAHLAA